MFVIVLNLKEEIVDIEKELEKTKKVLGQLIVWLTRELGEANVKELINELTSKR